MNLEIQIQSLFVSFVYGLFVSLLFNLLYYLLFYKRKIICIICDLIFNISLFSLFFYIMYLINNANIHPYFLGLLITGFFVGNHNLKKLRIIVKNNGSE